MSTVTPNTILTMPKVMLYIWWNQLGVVYYELLKPSETIKGDRYRTQLMCLSRDEVILQHRNARPHVASWSRHIWKR